MKNIPQWFPRHERPNTLVDMMKRMLKGGVVLWHDDGLEPKFDIIFVSLALSSCHIIGLF
jgi:hypothetical protein